MTEEIELLKEDLESKIESLRKSLATLRTGRASAKMLDGIQCEYYGDKIPLNQIASVQVPEPRQLLIKPYDRNDIKSIVAALNASNIGITPINDGNVVRLNVPALTEERRREIAKTAKKYAEEGKVAIRNIRRDGLDGFKKLKNAKEITEDQYAEYESAIEKLTQKTVEAIDKVIADKEKELLTV